MRGHNNVNRGTKAACKQRGAPAIAPGDVGAAGSVSFQRMAVQPACMALSNAGEVRNQDKREERIQLNENQ